MKREIKFRGMGVDGTFHYGNLAIIEKKIDHIKSGCYISNSVGMPFAYSVRPETVGQFIGLKDIDKNDIYEGDTVSFTRKNESRVGNIGFNHLHCCYGIFDEANGYIQDLLANPYDAKGKPNKIWQDDNVKIIGSIHEIKESEQQYERFDEAADNEAAGR